MALELGYKLALLDEPFESLDVRRRLLMVNDLNNFQGSLMINTHDFGTLKSLPNWGLYHMMFEYLQVLMELLL